MSSFCEPWKEPFLSTPNFSEAKSTAKLKELAIRAPDLSVPGVITEERMVSMSSRGAGIILLYGFQRVDQQIIRGFQELADERCAVKQMQALFAGKPVNFIEGFASERRAVLHPATRDVFELSVTQDQPVRQLIDAQLQKLCAFFAESKDEFNTLLFIGIGGSELGPHAIVEALKPYHTASKQVKYLANVDPDEMSEALRGLDLNKTLVAVVSKSGTTLETATNEARARYVFEQASIDPKNHFIAVTMPKSPMDDAARYRYVFHVFDFVGGRFSSTSTVGGVLICFMAGVDAFLEFLEGANEMDRLALSLDVHENLPLLLALLAVWNRNFLNYPTTAIIPYSCALNRFPAHLQQCEMESNGKSVDRFGQKVRFSTGPIIWGESGTNAQHSFFQLLHQGTDIVPVEFIGFKESQFSDDFMFNGTSSQDKLVANLFAQALALASGQSNENPNKSFAGNRPSTIILAKKLDAKTLGALLSLYEHKVAYQGFLWGINSFDQEGVQLGKVLAERLLAIIKSRREGRDNVTSNPVGRRLLDILDDMTSLRGV